MQGQRERHGFLQGAIIISLGSFLAKVVGAVSRIPLTALLGAEGVGLYQLAYPFYCLLLTVSSAGLPSGISRIVAREEHLGRDGKPVFRAAFSLFFFIGLIGTLLMFALRGVISNLQGEDLRACYIALSPSVLCVSLLSVFRGYFQGKCDMVPTATSDLIEQTVKGVFAVFLAYIFRENTLYAVTAVLGAVSLSEGWALWYMYRRYRVGRGNKPLFSYPQPSYGKILSLTLPVALAAAILPLSQFIDSGLAVRLLRSYSGEAVALYGLFSGGAVTLVGLPVSVCYGFAVSVIPRLSSNLGGRGKVLKALGVTLIVSVPCALALFFFARPLGALFFRRLTEERLDVLEKLIKLMSFTAVTHSCAQTLSACLIGKGKALVAARNMAVAVTIKIILTYFLLKNQNISVYGMAIAANVCYFLAFVLDLYSNLKREKIKK
ncbi:MAG: polysaccharide biosynthesis protein [Clostridia bacterium]|nr:polysaccharide biosynthesis protein [Clostridia bacterium]